MALFGAAPCAGVLCAQLTPSARVETLAPKLVYILPAPGEAGLTTLQTRAPADSIVLDLRWSATDLPVASWLAALSARANAGGVALVLISEQTPQGLRDALRTGVRGCLTFAAQSANIVADFTVATTPADDQKAADSLRSGATAESLINSVLEKRRYDEASVVRQHTTGRDEPPSDEESPAETGSASTTKPIDGKESQPPTTSSPIDGVLQRAVQVYRGLVVLKRAQ